jgi:DNA gyrase subunit A
MLISDRGKLIRMSASDISSVGRNTLGVRLINLSEDEKLIGAARIDEKEEDPDEEQDTDNQDSDLTDEE